MGKRINLKTELFTFLSLLVIPEKASKVARRRLFQSVQSKTTKLLITRLFITDKTNEIKNHLNNLILYLNPIGNEKNNAGSFKLVN